jgi:hypothetical protein
MFNIVKRRDFMLGQAAQTRQEAEKLLAEKYDQDHIVVEANELPSNPCIRQPGGQTYGAESAIADRHRRPSRARQQDRVDG